MLQRNKSVRLVRDVVGSSLRIGQTASVVGRTGVNWLLGRRPPAPVLMRQTFEQLGATYIKLGQFIASAPSLFPREYVDAFQGCLDDVPSLPFDYIRRTLEEEFERPLSEIYSHIEEQPLASASIAQVHAATLVSGEDVVIKVQKPGVETVLATDFNVLYASARVLERLVPGVDRASLGDVIGDVQATMLKECDFLAEANNIEIFRDFLRDSGNQFALAPKVYHKATTRRVLTMERFYGVPFTDLESIRKYSPRPEFTLINALNTWMDSLVRCQFFHADVHAGNLMVLEDGRVGFIDFGIVGHIRKETWQALIDFMQGRASGNYLLMAQCMLTIGVTSDNVNVNDLARDLRDLIESAQSMIEGPAEQDMDTDEAERFMLAIVDLGRKHGVRFPKEFALLLKQLLYFDRYIQLLAPNLSPFDDSRIQLMH
ncbi:ABC1 family protein kinase-like protein [Oceanococcus atlanticus]|uniref:ABC1 family protein kinase-like protein n=1 Tax=Oceanococcus atlanticus TaxID=1317117 RepID=A0A1Y1SHR8_9GAMM|nr:AarF/UbiB family protein [Oceanococcus atlanticus]ORE89187.1 ABC1 family protein kinase-like protein [Oceanococcus atlanticus]